MAIKTKQSTVSKQIEDYKLQFELLREMMAEKKNFEMEGDIRSEMNTTSRYRQMGWEGNYWIWDEEWDGSLVSIVQQIDNAGYHVSKFLRSRKILISGMTNLSQVDLFSTIHSITGDIANIRFASRTSAWIQLKKPVKGAKKDLEY